MLAVLANRKLAEFVLLRMVSLEDALAVVACCRLASQLRVRPVALEVSTSTQVVPFSKNVDLSCLEALRFPGDVRGPLPRLRALDISPHRDAVLPNLVGVETLRLRGAFGLECLFSGDTQSLHTLVVDSSFTENELKTLASRAPLLRRLVCRRLLHGRAQALSLPLEELALREQIPPLLCPLPRTLHKVRATVQQRLTLAELRLFNLDKLQQLTLTAAKPCTVRLQHFTTNKLEVLRLTGFTVETDHASVQLPANLRMVELHDCSLQNGGMYALEIRLDSKSILNSFVFRSAHGSMCPLISARSAPVLRHLELGPVHLCTSFLKHLDPQDLQRLELNIASLNWSSPLSLPLSRVLTCLDVRGVNLNANWCEFFSAAFPNLQDLTLSVYGDELQENFKRLLGRLRKLRLVVALGLASFVEALFFSLGPSLTELSIDGCLRDAQIDDLVVPDHIAAQLTSLQLGTRKFGQRATRVMPVDFIRREIEAELGY
jgi:hypothetical protein